MKNKFFIIYIFIALLFTACESKSDCYQNYYENITNYEINSNISTKLGIRVDSSDYKVDLQELDNRITKIENCIKQVALEVENTPQNEKKKWQCLHDVDPNTGLKYKCIVIKIIAPHYSKCSDWQFIGVKAPDQYCLDKGITPTVDCPCMWRTAIQDNNHIITPPALYLWEIGRIMTSCNNIWYSPFAKCLIF